MDIPESITARRMYDELVETMAGKERCYLLLDEIQEIVDWEKVVNSLLEGADADIYVTGSNAKLMPREISACLAGRYVSIPVYTLSFREYLDFKADSNLSGRALLEEYIRFGGFPIATLHRYDTQSTYQIVNGIYHTVSSCYNIFASEEWQSATSRGISLLKLLEWEGNGLTLFSKGFVPVIKSVSYLPIRSVRFVQVEPRVRVTKQIESAMGKDGSVHCKFLQE